MIKAVSQGPRGQAEISARRRRTHRPDVAGVRRTKRRARNAGAGSRRRVARSRHVPLEIAGSSRRRRGRSGHRNAGARRASPTTTSPAAGAPWSAPPASRRSARSCRKQVSTQVFADGQIPTAAISFFPAGTRRARGRRLPAQWPLALQQRHPPFRVGRRRHRGRRQRSRKRRPSDRDVFGAARPRM